MSAPGLTTEAQLRYLLQWFGEFSELQREDFLPVLAAARGDNPDQLAVTLANLTCQDKPVSLFQCRIKLFNEWYPSWTEEDRERLVKGVSDMDPEFGTKLVNYITNGPEVNGVNDEEHPVDTTEPNNDNCGDLDVEGNVEVPPLEETTAVEIVAAS